MMDYEFLYENMQLFEKDIKDKLTYATKVYRNLSKNSETGELKALSKDLMQMTNFVAEFGALLSDYKYLVEDFNTAKYMESGDFAQQMTECCKNLQVDIKGEYPVYEMFPHKVKIDSENAELYIDRKKVQCARPQHFVKLIKKSQDKLNKASFNVTAFLNELAAAYDSAVIHKAKNKSTSEADIYLKDLYNYLVPMQRFRKEYDMQSYAFDLARLYNSDIETTKDNRAFQLGPSRQSGKMIRILDKEGKEQFLGTIRFFACKEA